MRAGEKLSNSPSSLDRQRDRLDCGEIELLRRAVDVEADQRPATARK
jgi:hypothetical protein